MVKRPFAKICVDVNFKKFCKILCEGLHLVCIKFALNVVFYGHLKDICYDLTVDTILGKLMIRMRLRNIAITMKSVVEKLFLRPSSIHCAN